MTRLTHGPLALLNGAHEPADRNELNLLRRHALLPLLVAGGLLAAWSASAPLAGAVVAPASVKVELNRKTVQHQEGGIVRDLHVRDGQQVRAGDPLMVVADLRSDAELAVLRDRWRAARARMARANAEASLAPRLDAPAELVSDPLAAEHMARERGIFATRRQALEERDRLLRAQLGEAGAQAAGLQTQIESTAQSVRLSDEELALNDKLATEGFVHRSRLIGLQRIAADYRARMGEHRSELASVNQRAGELRSSAAQLRLQHQTQAADELRDASAALREIEERLRPSHDHVERQTVRAPVDGQVMALRVAGPGAVIAPREALLDVVPLREQLVVEARIAPQDIEHVRVGGAAEVRLLGSQARLLPPLPARVAFVAADRRTDERSGQAWFDVTVEVDAAAVRQHGGPQLQPGLPAELYVTTAERTLLQYLLAPLQLFSQRALREP